MPPPDLGGWRLMQGTGRRWRLPLAPRVRHVRDANDPGILHVAPAAAASVVLCLASVSIHGVGRQWLRASAPSKPQHIRNLKVCVAVGPQPNFRLTLGPGGLRSCCYKT